MENSDKHGGSHPPIMNFPQRMRWAMTVMASKGPNPTAKNIAFALAFRMNSETGDLFPSYTRLAADVGVDPRNAMKAVKALVDAGWVETTARKNSSNSFRLLTPEAITGDEIVTGDANVRGDEFITPRGDGSITPPVTKSSTPGDGRITPGVTGAPPQGVTETSPKQVSQQASIREENRTPIREGAVPARSGRPTASRPEPSPANVVPFVHQPDKPKAPTPAPAPEPARDYRNGRFIVPAETYARWEANFRELSLGAELEGMVAWIVGKKPERDWVSTAASLLSKKNNEARDKRMHIEVQAREAARIGAQPPKPKLSII